MPLPSVTPEELIEVLKRSSLPTLLVEGKDDASIYRWIEKKIDVRDLDILPCSGRSTLLKVFESREEFMETKVVFTADQDKWVYENIPEGYEDIIFTSGYSIENDLFVGSSFLIEKVLEEDGKNKFDTMFQKLKEWYSFEIIKFQNEKEYVLDYNIRKIFNAQLDNLCPSFLREVNFKKPLKEEVEKINTLNIRGKFLFELLELVLQSKKYKAYHFIEIITKFDEENIYLNSLIERIRLKFEGDRIPSSIVI